MILAIDPGDQQSGWVLVKEDLSGIIKAGKSSNLELLSIITDLSLRKYQIGHIAIEMIASYGMPVGRNVFETCCWIGVFALHCKNLFGLNATLIYRKDEKIVICNDSKAKDANIRRALIDRFADHDLKNGKGTKANPDYFYGFKADMWAAMAVAVTYKELKERNENEKTNYQRKRIEI